MSLDFGNPKRALGALALAGLISACGATEETGPVLSYSDAFIVQPLDGRDMTLAGLELSVEGGEISLVGVETPVADTVELHTMGMEDGIMRMRQVESFSVSEDEPLSLKRGSDHLMVFGVTEPLELGETVDMTFAFETDSGPLTLVVDAEVRSLVD